MSVSSTSQPSPGTDDDAERIARYEAWLTKLQATRADYVRRDPLYRRFFVGFFLVGVACFAFGPLVGVWGTLCTALIGIVGYLMVKTRVWEFDNEIEENRREIARLRERSS